MTWGRAVDVWASGWCEYASYCSPRTYESYGGAPSCHGTIVTLSCGKNVSWDCEDPYQHTPEDLEECRLDFLSLPCGSIFAPASCYAAFVYHPLPWSF